jgi:hypothetical protein
MTYSGTVRRGVVVFRGRKKPREGASVRVEEVTKSEEVGQTLEQLAGKAVGLPKDLAKKHDAYRKERRGS